MLLPLLSLRRRLQLAMLTWPLLLLLLQLMPLQVLLSSSSRIQVRTLLQVWQEHHAHWCSSRGSSSLQNQQQ
jgi:hypothetical protein